MNSKQICEDYKRLIREAIKIANKQVNLKEYEFQEYYCNDNSIKISYVDKKGIYKKGDIGYWKEVFIFFCDLDKELQ